uniref:Uncharacterized protein n=1 Tax=Oryza sativa subsp. japonica TaxID=39947 RepID=Q6ETN7_ORYSJ|nr:hypothetical protein [Oryza sativa Japonica Group]
MAATRHGRRRHSPAGRRAAAVGHRMGWEVRRGGEGRRKGRRGGWEVRRGGGVRSVNRKGNGSVKFPVDVTNQD